MFALDFLNLSIAVKLSLNIGFESVYNKQTRFVDLLQRYT